MHALRVLIVDDVYIMRNLIRKVMEDAGHVIVGEAKDGEEGVEMFQQLQPDLVTMDVNMPIKDGLEALKEIKKLDPDVPVLTISGVRDSKVMEAMEEAGSYSFVRKPFQPAYLLRRIEDIEPRKQQEPVAEPAVESLEPNLEPTPVAAALIDDFDDVYDLMDVEFDLPNKGAELPDPVLVLSSDSDVMEVEGQTDESKHAHALLPPEKAVVRDQEVKSKEASEAPVEEDEDIVFDIHPQESVPEPEPDWEPRPRLRPDVDPTPVLEPTIERIVPEEERGRPVFAANRPALAAEPPVERIPPPVPPRPVNLSAPVPPRNARYHEPPERLKELRQREMEKQDEYEMVIYNAEPEYDETRKPSLWQTILSLFRKNK